MEINKIIEFVKVEIEGLEKEIYFFESVAYPTFENQKLILEKLKKDYLKMVSLLERQNKGEDVTVEEINEAVPVQFR